MSVTLSSIGGDVRVRLRGTVTRVARLDDGGTELAVAFLDPSPEVQQRLEVLIARVIEGTGSGLLGTLAANARPDEVRAVLAKMPPAHRINLAVRAQIQERRFLRMDTNPLVLEALARNPNTTADEALGLARNPTLRPSTVEILAVDPRWHRHEELQIVVASHPQASLRTAEKAAGRLSPQGRQRLLARPSLNSILRQRLVATRGRVRGS